MKKPHEICRVRKISCALVEQIKEIAKEKGYDEIHALATEALATVDNSPLLAWMSREPRKRVDKKERKRN